MARKIFINNDIPTLPYKGEDGDAQTHFVQKCDRWGSEMTKVLFKFN